MNIIWFKKFKRKVKKCLYNKKIKIDNKNPGAIHILPINKLLLSSSFFII